MRIHQLMSLLSVVGEYPVCSIDLLGEKRCFRRLITDLIAKQEFWNIDNDEVFDCVAVGLSGKGKYKTIRLRKRAVPMLSWCGGEAHYEENYMQSTFSGSVEYVDRNHRVAETVAMVQGAGIEYRPWAMPELQTDIQDKNNICEAVYYTSRKIKKSYDDIPQFIGSTRFTGVLMTPKDAFTVYNARDGVMKWGHKGEYKSLNIIKECVACNTQNNNVTKMILMGRTLEIVMETISQSEKEEAIEIRKNRKQKYKSYTSIPSIYRTVHYVPLSEFGQKLLKILTVPDYRGKVLRLIYEEDELSNGTENFVYDAYRKNRYVLSFLDGDITRLRQFKKTMLDYQKKGEPVSCAVLCFKEQSEEVTEYMSDCEDVNIPTVKIENVLKLLQEDGEI